MKIISIKENNKYLTEYIKLCNKEWGTKKPKEQLQEYIEKKKQNIHNKDKVIKVLGLIDNNTLIGFISLFKYDGNERKDLTPWYATLYIKEKYRGLGYSKLLNNAILKEAIKLGYKKVYLKTTLINYYEKYGFKYKEKLNNKEKIYYINLDR